MIPNSKWLSKGSANAAFQTLFSDELMRILKRPIETSNHLKTALALAGAAPTDSEYRLEDKKQHGWINLFANASHRGGPRPGSLETPGLRQ
jgi:hypothetical protein